MTTATDDQEKAQLRQEVALLREQVRLLMVRLYGRKSEQFSRDADSEQFSLFDAPEVAEPEGTDEGVQPAVQEVTSHTRRKPGRKPLPDCLPRIPIVLDVAEVDKICGCGARKTHINDETSEQLDIVPARIQVLRHIRPKYACGACQGTADATATVVIAPLPVQLIPKSLASAGVLAHVVTAKFADHIPLYRQEGQFKRLGVDIGRNTMCGWLVRTAKACEPLVSLMREEIRAGPLINCDETTLQVLVEEGRAPTTQSYMWVFRGGTAEQPCIEFLYNSSRGADVAANYLRGYKGFVQTDGYAGYDFLDASPDIAHLGCWTHVRRKFMEVVKAVGKAHGPKTVRSLAQVAVDRIAELYAIEKQGRERGLSPPELQALRQDLARPKIEALHAWLMARAPEVPPKSLLGKAISYALGQWSRLDKYLLDGRLRPDNNLAENAIRPFVVGRKNWLFSGTAEGAKASSTLFSLVETARANGLDPYWYLRQLFEVLPKAANEAQLRALLPQYVDHEHLNFLARALSPPSDPTLR